jgi:hypothetical protein
MPSSNVVSWAEYRHRSLADRSDVMARFAFDMCEQTFLRRDWQRFEYWFRVARSQRRGWEPSRSNLAESVAPFDNPAHVQEQLDQPRLAHAHGGLPRRHPLALAHALLRPVVELLLHRQRVDVDRAQR